MIVGNCLRISFLLCMSVVHPLIGWTADLSFEKHWSFPLELQGKAPQSFSGLEASLHPDACGTCHEAQYSDWKGSRHSKAMGPGVTGQFHSPWLSKAGVLSCTNCHAPLAEQSPFLIQSDERIVKNSSFLPDLRPEGIACAGCHVRKHVRYGPRVRGGKAARLPHDGFVEADNFGKSEFCKPCHQFDESDNRVNGKLLENTYEEWKRSPYAEKGIQCADCHMPGRKHLWQGIHNPEMVKEGLTIKASRKGSNIILAITNSGVGHKFPTYVTPKVVIHGSVVNRKGEEILKTVQEKYIGWYIPIDLSEEVYDTRIAPGDTFNAEFSWKNNYKSGKYRIVIRVYPDDFYMRFFEALMNNPPAGIDLKNIKEAYKDTQESAFTLYEKSWDI